MTLSSNLLSRNQDVSYEMVSSAGFHQLHGTVSKYVTPLSNGTTQTNVTVESRAKEQGATKGIIFESDMLNQSLIQEADLESRKLLVIVTPVYDHPFQARNLHRLAHVLKLVSAPLIWIVVEMNSQSAQTTDILRGTGIMYRHLVCEKNRTDVRDKSIHQRNVALFHIETHRLDGIVYFADEENIYSEDLFAQMRQIRRFGTWPVAKLISNQMQVAVEGPVCNGTQVIGWHAIKSSRRSQRFYAHLSGFAFNSTIIWDPKRWHRPTLERIRKLDTENDDLQASTFIEQIVEDETQMECLSRDCSRIMVWHLHHETTNAFYPRKWLMSFLHFPEFLLQMQTIFLKETNIQL